MAINQILSLGHVVPIRNRVTLARMCGRLAEFGLRPNIIIAGDVKDVSYRGVAEDLGILDQFAELGPYHPDDLPALLNKADFEAHDLDGYALGLTSLEAVKLGTPILASVNPANFPDAKLPSCILADASIEELAVEAQKLLLDERYRRLVCQEQLHFVKSFYDIDRINTRYINLLFGIPSVEKERH